MSLLLHCHLGGACADVLSSDTRITTRPSDANFPSRTLWRSCSGPRTVSGNDQRWLCLSDSASLCCIPGCCRAVWCRCISLLSLGLSRTTWDPLSVISRRHREGKTLLYITSGLQVPVFTDQFERTFLKSINQSNFCIALWVIAVAEFQSVKHRYSWSTILTHSTWKINTKYMTDKLVNIDWVEIGSSSVALDWTWLIDYLQAAKAMIARGHIALQSCSPIGALI